MSLPDISQADALRSTSVLVGFAVAVSSTEYLVARPLLSDNGLLSSHVARFQSRWALAGAGRGAAAVVFGYRSFCAILLARLLSALAICALALAGRVSVVPVAICLIATFLVGVRSWYGADGAHQMNLVVLGALTVALVPGSEGSLVLVCLSFIAAQAGMAYAIAGFSKLSSSIWRSGRAMPGIMSTEIYGHDGMFRTLTRRQWLAQVSCWMTILLETAFVPLCLISPYTALGALAMMAVFHVGIAVFMGLNGFLISFVATYPAIWYVLGVLHHA